MTMIDVCFFSGLSLASETCRVALARTNTPAFHRQIGRAIRDGECFACYVAPEGPDFALDRDGCVARV